MICDYFIIVLESILLLYNPYSYSYKITNEGENFIKKLLKEKSKVEICFPISNLIPPEFSPSMVGEEPKIEKMGLDIPRIEKLNPQTKELLDRLGILFFSLKNFIYQENSEETGARQINEEELSLGSDLDLENHAEDDDNNTQLNPDEEEEFELKFNNANVCNKKLKVD